MKVEIFFKNGKSEAFDCKDLSTCDGNSLELVLKEKTIRPPDKHPVEFLFFFLRTIKKIEIVNEKSTKGRKR